jgi:DNA-3-methyladenine glycosylase II
MFDNFVNHIKKYDPVITNLVNKYGVVNLNPNSPKFKYLVKIIVSQQISSKAVETIFKKLSSKINDLFEPQLILKLNDQELSSIGLSKQKIGYIKELSLGVSKNELDLDKLSHEDDIKVYMELIKLKGFGDWSSRAFLLFGLGRENILISSDYGIRRAICNLYNLKELPGNDDVLWIARQNHWEPYCSFICLYLWKSLENTF